MRLINSFDLYDVYYVKYIQKYWVINKSQDVLELETTSLPEALASAEAYSRSLGMFILENEDNDNEA